VVVRELVEERSGRRLFLYATLHAVSTLNTRQLFSVECVLK